MDKQDRPNLETPIEVAPEDWLQLAAGIRAWRGELHETAARLRAAAWPYREDGPHSIPRAAAVFEAAEMLERVATTLEEPAAHAEREAEKLKLNGGELDRPEERRS